MTGPVVMGEVELKDLRMIFADAECVATPSMQRDMGDEVWAHIGPIGTFTDHPELQDALGLVCLAFNRRNGRLSASKHAELAQRDRGGAELLREALAAIEARAHGIEDTTE